MTESTPPLAGGPAGGGPAGTSVAASGAPLSGHSWALESAVAPGPAPGYVYVGFWQRLVAWFIDGIILGVVAVVLFVGVIGVAMSRVDWSSITVDPRTGQILSSDAEFMRAVAGFTLATFAAYGVTLLLTALYHIILWWLAGGTIGQRLMGMQVRAVADGRRIGFWRACLRYVGLLISLWAFGLGLLWVGIDDRKQGWHDKIASTFVVKRT